MLNIETTTSWWIHKSEFREDTLMNLRSKLSVIALREEKEIPKAIFEEGDYIVVPKVRKSMLESLLRKPLLFQDQRAPIIYHQHTWPDITKQPLPHQVDVIQNIKKIFTDEQEREQRVCLCAKPGLGKTYMTANVIASLGLRFIFIVYSAKLVEQTYQAFSEYLGKDGLYVMRRGRDFDGMDWTQVKGLFITHGMIRSLVSNYGLMNVMKAFMLEMQADIKIIDEFDREVASTYQMECFGNFSHNLYLTGTKFKNMRPDDSIFQAIYRHAHTFGSDVVIPTNRNAIVIRYKFNPSKGEYFQMQKFDETMFKIYYNNYLALKDVLLDYIMWVFWKQEDGILRTVINEGDSVVIYCGRIENCEIVRDKLIELYDVDKDDIGIYNSSISKGQKNIAETKPWIITTTESMGRGYDNSKIRVLIFLEFNFGTSSYIQNISRVARVGGKEGWVIEGLDESFWKVEANHKKKHKLGIYHEYFKSIQYHRIPESIQKKYYYGYRPTNPRAEEIKKKEEKRKKQMALHRQF